MDDNNNTIKPKAQTSIILEDDSESKENNSISEMSIEEDVDDEMSLEEDNDNEIIIKEIIVDDDDTPQSFKKLKKRRKSSFKLPIEDPNDSSSMKSSDEVLKDDSSSEDDENDIEEDTSEDEKMYTVERPRTRMKKRNLHLEKQKEMKDFNEDSDDEFRSEMRERKTKKFYTPNKAYTPVKFEKDSIDKVLNCRKKDGKEILLKEMLDFDFENDCEFEIKWSNYSYRHNDWLNYQDLEELKGFLRVKNFIRNMKKNGEEYGGATKEEIEQFNIEWELQQSIIDGYKVVERIVDAHDTDDGIMYFIKWKGLQYAECSWEKESDLNLENDLKQIDRFNRRMEEWQQKKGIWPLRRKFVEFEEDQLTQNGWLNTNENDDLKLRDYQIEGVNWMTYAFSQDTNVILADEMGLGKTIQTITFMKHLYDKFNITGPHLVVVPLSTISNWSKEFEKWAPCLNTVVYTGDSVSRNIIQQTEMMGDRQRPYKYNVLLTTYELVLKDQALINSISWGYLIVDEAHRLKNNESQLYEVLMKNENKNKLLITGTPLQNTLKELWALLHFLHPSRFPDFEDFEEQYQLNQAESVSKIHRELKAYLLRRLKKDVEKSLPPKKERILRVELTNLQKQYYRWIVTRNSEALKLSMKQSRSSLMNICMELKKLCNHPVLINEDMNEITHDNLVNSCGKMILLDKLLDRLKETGHRVLIFSQMVRMLDILSAYLTFKGFSHQRLDGSMSREMRQRAMDHFNEKDSNDFAFLLSTRAGGLGINLTTADTVIIYDSDWNPQNDLQAQARCHRIGQEKVVNIYRLATEGTVEENILLSAKRKMVLDHLIIQTMDTKGKSSKTTEVFDKNELEKILEFGAQDIFNKENMKDKKEMNIDEILERADVEENEDQSGLNDLFGAFNVANFAISKTAGNEKHIVEKGAQRDSLNEDIKQINNSKEFWNAIISEQDKEEARLLDQQILGIVPTKKSGKLERRKRKVIEEIDERIVRGVLKGMRRFGFARYNDILGIVKQSYKKESSTLEDTIKNLMERITNACFKIDVNEGNVKELEMYVEGIRFSPLELLTKNDEMRIVGILMKFMLTHDGKLPMKVKKPQWCNAGEWKEEYDQTIIRLVQKYGFGVWSEVLKVESENEKLKEVINAGATVNSYQKRVEVIIRHTREFMRSKKVRKEKRKQIREHRKEIAEQNNEHFNKEESEIKSTINTKEILSKMVDVKSAIKKLKYIKTHTELDEKIKLEKSEKYIQEIALFIQKSGENEMTKKQMWYFVSTYSIFSYREVIELITNKRMIDNSETTSHQAKRTLKK